MFGLTRTDKTRNKRAGSLLLFIWDGFSVLRNEEKGPVSLLCINESCRSYSDDAFTLVKSPPD